MWNRTRILPALAISAALAVGACEGGQQEAGEMTEDVEETDLSADIDRPVGEIEERGEARLEQRNDSGITGEVKTSRIDGAIEVVALLEGARPGERYLGHLHRGTCDDVRAQVVPLSRFENTPEGRTRSVTRIDASSLEPGESYLVQVHGSEEAVVACGSLPGPGDVGRSTAPHSDDL
ncbi:MAG: hypothetical protein KY397_05690 [Gemmatimonadetes bacterium]|nr:hypothetical protein [Gemmatimonadota bacterium]